MKHIILKFLPDKLYLKLRFYKVFKKRLNLKNPKTYSEKLQWIKLYDRNPKYIEMVDKYMAKEYVSKIIGNEYIIPTIGVWDSPEKISFEELPSQFVLKATHDSGSTIICKDKDNFNIQKAVNSLNKAMKNNYYFGGREWPYKYVKRRIIAEPYMEDYETKELRDYKFFTFNGKVKMLFIASDRQNANSETKFDFYDEKFNHLDIRNGHDGAITIPKKPKNFDLMVILAEKLSKGIPHLRVDFYEINGKVYFGELTFFHWSGFVRFEPNEWDYRIGQWLELPQKKR